MDITIEQTLAQAQGLINDFQGLTLDADYERKGILFSEMFFLFSTTALLQPAKIVESGRARGQSTVILARCFPQMPVISIEHDRNSADVAVAERRLASFANVELLYGDAMAIAPAKLVEGDVVLIDGPKGFRGLRFAMDLLRTRKPAAVFVHDCPVGSPERWFLEQFIPEAFYSDHRDFVRRYAFLDQNQDAQLDEQLAQQLAAPSDKATGYGPTLACIPHNSRRSYMTTLVMLVLTGTWLRLRRSLAKRRSGAPSRV